MSSKKSDLNLFGTMFQKIDQSFGGGKKLQVVYPFINWTWPTPKAGYINLTAYELVGRIPEWSAIGKPYRASADDVNQQYVELLTRCPSLVITKEKEQQVKEATTQINQARQQLVADSKQAVAAYKNMPLPPGYPKLDYYKWMDENGWTATIHADNVNLLKAISTKLEIVAQENPDHVRVVNAAITPTGSQPKAGFVLPTVGKEPMPNYDIAPGSDWIDHIKHGGASITIDMSASASSSSLESSWAHGVTDTDYFFFQVYVDSTWKRFDLTDKDTNVNVSITIKNVTPVPVGPDRAWYNSGYLKAIADENRWNSPYTTTGGSAPVFGKGGFLPLVITGMIAAYQPSFKITMSESTFTEHKSEFSSCDGFRIGPFQFGSGDSRSSSSDTWKRNASSNTFSGHSTSQYPCIMAFTVAKPGLD